jgi:hypothetical protein
MAKVFQYSGWLVAIILFVYAAFLTNNYLKAQKLLLNAVSTDSARESTIPEDSAKGLEIEFELIHTRDVLSFVEKELAACRSGETFSVVDLAEDTEVVFSSLNEMSEAELNAQLIQTKESLALAREKLEACWEENTQEADTDAGGLGMDDEVPDAAAEEGEEDSNATSQAERVARAQLDIVVNMTYGDLIAELGLTTEEAAPLRDALAANMKKQQEVMQGAFRSKDQTAKSVRAARDALRLELRSEVKGVLNGEELAAFDEYDAVADQILYEKMVDGQLNMMASGLSNENRVLSSQVVGEELVRELDALDQTDTLYTLQSFNAAQTRALNASLERLTETLDDEQYAMVDGFVNQAIAMFDAMAEQNGGE